VGLPQPLSVYGNGYLSGNLGIGTSTPANLLTIATSSPIFTVAASGNVGIGTANPTQALTMNGGTFLQIPKNPKIAGTVIDNSKLYGANDVFVSGKYAYVTDNDNGNAIYGFAVVDIANPTSPQIVGSISNSNRSFNTPSSVYVAGRYAYVTSQNGISGANFTVIDIANPTSPQIVGSLDDDTNLFNAERTVVSGKYVYVINYNYGANSFYTPGKAAFTVLDVSNPVAPNVVSSIPADPNWKNLSALTIAGKYVYVATGDLDYDPPTNGVIPGFKNIAVIDVSNPASPAIVGAFAEKYLEHIMSIAVSGKYLYFTAFPSGPSALYILDISNPASPQLVTKVYDPALYYARSIFIAGKYLYAANYNADPGRANVAIFDISNPASPRVVGSLDEDVNLRYPLSLFVSGKYAYAIRDGELTVVDISGIDSPAASIGSLVAGTANISGNLDVANNLSVGGGVNAGSGGISSAGPLTAVGNSAANALSALDAIGSAGASLLSVRNDGTIGIGTSTPKAKLQVAGGDLYLESQGSGMVMQETNGGNCRRLLVLNDGTATTSDPFACP